MFAIIPLTISIGLLLLTLEYYNWMFFISALVMLAIGILFAGLELSFYLSNRPVRRRRSAGGR